MTEKLKKDFEADDPYELVGIGFPVSDSFDANAEMGRCFIEEFAMLGYSRSFIQRMFKSPYYQGPHRVYLSHGSDFVESLLDQCFGPLSQQGATHGE